MRRRICTSSSTTSTVVLAGAESIAFGQRVLCRFGAVKAMSFTEEEYPHSNHHRYHERDGVFNDVVQEGRSVNLLMIGDGFHHEIGAVAHIGVSAEEAG